MKSFNGMAMQTALQLADAPDIYLLFMAGVVFLTGIAAVGSIVLLLLLAPVVRLVLGRRGSPRRQPAAVTDPNRD